MSADHSSAPSDPEGAQQLSQQLGSLFRAFSFAVSSLYSHLLFLNEQEGRPLRVEGFPSGTRFIRFSLDEAECLHLESIRVLASVGGKIVNIAPQAQIKTSSCWGDTAHLVERRAVLTGKHEGEPFGFHTDRQARPWALVTLNEPAEISAVIVNNRSDVWAGRGVGLIVSASVDGKNFLTIHDNRKEILSCRSRLEKAVESQLLPNEAKAALRFGTDLLFAWCIGRRDEVSNLFSQGLVKGELHRLMCQLFNAEVLHQQELEITAHGLVRPFRFWSTSEKRGYLSFAVQVMDLLKVVSPHVCLGYGSVLGLVRNQDLIPHDDDLDVLIAFRREEATTFGAVLERIEAHLRGAGLQTGGGFTAHRHVWASGSKKLDVFTGFVENDYVFFHPGPRHRIRVDDMFPSMMAEFFEVRLPLPRNPFRYLGHVYGPEWARPAPHFRHNWNADLSDFL